MKISILVIAHNEERYIAECIESLLRQTKRPDEIVFLAHNCTDKTVEIARTFHITVIPFDGPTGIINARLEGLRHVSGDIILCVDGDSIAQENWVEVMTATLQKNNMVLVGSWVRFFGTVYGRLYNAYSRYAAQVSYADIGYWIWGVSCAFWGKDKEFVREVFTRSVEWSREAGLPRNPEDYWLALCMGTRGSLACTNKTYVMQYPKEISSLLMLLRRIESLKNRAKMRLMFAKTIVPRDRVPHTPNKA